MAVSKSKQLVDILRAKNFAHIDYLSEDLLEVSLQKGEFSPKEPWFLKDSKGREYVVLPQNVLDAMISLIRNVHEERLKTQIQRDLISFAPIDFDDVMSVVNSHLEDLRNEDGSLPPVDSMRLIGEIKKKYPNLFLNLENFNLLVGVPEGS